MNDPERPTSPDGETVERGPEDRPTVLRPGRHAAIGRRIAGRYEILEALGSGGFGTVYRARDQLLDRLVALKVARPRGDDSTASSRFQREARATARLEHPNAVRIYDAGEDPEGLFLVLELVEGESVQARLRQGALPPAMVAAIGHQAASALAAAHALHIVHRDIKPANLLLAGDGGVKVADFGIARLLGEERLTSEGSVIGTPDYMAPEQIEGGEVGPASDMFALGVVLYEMLSGRRPFGPGTTSEVLARIVRAAVPPLPAEVREREKDLCRTILALLQKRPEDRPAAAQVAAALGVSGQRGAPGPDGMGRRRLIGVALVMAVVAAIAVVGFRGRRPTETAEPSRVSPAPAMPIEARTATLSRIDLGLPPPPGAQDSPLLALQTRLRVGAGSGALTVERGSARQVLVKAPSDHIDHAMTAFAILDSLDGTAFTTPNLFTSRERSLRTVSWSLHGFDTARFLYTVGAATGWPVVVDNATAGPTTLELNDVPWDVATHTLMEMRDLRSIRIGGIWIVTTRERAPAIEALDTQFLHSYVPRRSSPAKLAALLESARSDRGVVALNGRLGRIVLADRGGLISRYSGIVEAVEGEPLPSPYTGGPVSLDLYQADFQDLLRLFADISGLNVVVKPGIADGRTTMRFHGVAWDNTLDAILLVHGLAWKVQGNVLTIFKPREKEEPAVETFRLAHEDPRFFLAFSRCLTAAGTLRVDETSRTLVVRDAPERTRWFAGLVKDLDVRAGRRAGTTPEPR